MIGRYLSSLGGIIAAAICIHRWFLFYLFVPLRVSLFFSLSLKLLLNVFPNTCRPNWILKASFSSSLSPWLCLCPWVGRLLSLWVSLCLCICVFIYLSFFCFFCLSVSACLSRSLSVCVCLCLSLWLREVNRPYLHVCPTKQSSSVPNLPQNCIKDYIQGDCVILPLTLVLC